MASTTFRNEQCLIVVLGPAIAIARHPCEAGHGQELILGVDQLAGHPLQLVVERDASAISSASIVS
jgi:hypothetical protein